MDHGAGKGQREAWDSMGSHCCEAGAESSMQPPAMSQRGPVAGAPSRHQQGCMTVRTDPQFVWLH